MFVRIRLFVLLILCIIVVSSCVDKTHEEEIVHKLELSVSELPIISSMGESVAFKVTSTMPWSIGDVQEWCIVSPTLGLEGTTEVTVTCSENEAYNQRNSNIIISAGTFCENLLVTQKQKDALLLSSNKIEIASDGGESALEISSNVAYEYEIEDDCTDWIKVKESRGLTKDILVIEIAQNNKKEKRKGKIKFTANSLNEIVTIFQDGFEPTMVLSQNKYNVDSGENNIKIELKSNINYKMILPEHVSWIQEADTRALSSYTHYLHILANDTYDTRRAEICFLNTDFDVEEKVTILQMQCDAILVAQNEYVISATTTNFSFEVNTNVDFKVETSVPWIKEQFIDSRSLEIVPIRFKVDENISLEPREGYINVSYKDIQQTIKIIQEGRVDYGKLGIIHTNSQFHIPQLVGDNLLGNINWGDGNIENYKNGISHLYTPNKLEHEVTIECWGAKEVRISNITGISCVDLSEF